MAPSLLTSAYVVVHRGKMKIFARLQFDGGDGGIEQLSVQSYHSLINMTTDGMIKKYGH